MRMDDTAITPNVKCSAGVMSRLMLQPYCDGLRVVRGSGDRCRGGVSACAKPDLDGLPVAQVPGVRAAHGGIRSTGGRRYARTPATKDCLECRFTTSFCGFSGAGEVSAYRAIRAGRRIGRHRPARLRVVAAGDDRSPIPSRPVRSSTTPDRRIRSSWERGSTPRSVRVPKPAVGTTAVWFGWARWSRCETSAQRPKPTSCPFLHGPRRRTGGR
jgi:hypothetical protein